MIGREAKHGESWATTGGGDVDIGASMRVPM